MAPFPEHVPNLISLRQFWGQGQNFSLRLLGLDCFQLGMICVTKVTHLGGSRPWPPCAPRSMCRGRLTLFNTLLYCLSQLLTGMYYFCNLQNSTRLFNREF